MRKQKGFIRLEGLGELIVLAIVGLVALIGGAVWLIWWLWTHLNISFI